MTKYASTTAVSTDASRAEIERTLKRYGATSFFYGTEDGKGAMIGFKLSGRMMKFVLPLPDVNERQFTHTAARGLRRTVDQQMAEWKQACRQKWRALALVIKAKLEAVEAGITTIEDEFLASTVMADGQTVGEAVKKPLADMYLSGQMPSSLLLEHHQ